METQIKEDMKAAMRAKDSLRVTTLRSIIAASTNELVAKGKTPQEHLTDEETIAVIQREAKKRKDSISQYTKANRPELSEVEEKELSIIEEYLPQMMDKDDIRPIVVAKKEALKLEQKSDMGKLIGAVMAELKGKADGTLVKEIVEEELS